VALYRPVKNSDGRQPERRRSPPSRLENPNSSKGLAALLRLSAGVGIPDTRSAAGRQSRALISDRPWMTSRFTRMPGSPHPVKLPIFPPLGLYAAFPEQIAIFSTHGSEAGAIGTLNAETTRQGAIFTCINDIELRMITTLLSLLLSPPPREPRPADPSPPKTGRRVRRRSPPGRRR
jgi:hypothetical protein